MRAAGAPSVLATFFLVAVAATVDSPVSARGGHGQFGKPLEGLTLDERKLFRDGKDEFEQVQSVASGLGPIFNNVSCVACHSVPAVGGSSPITETRAQRVDGSGNHFELPGGSLFQSDAISPNCRETIPADANVIARRQTTPLFGAGLIEAIPDAQIEAYRAEQAAAHPEQAGLVNHVFDVATGISRVGRFGWKDQQATLLAFSADAYLNEMGITSRLFPVENAPNGNTGKLSACDTVPDPEDTKNDIVAFENFMRMLAPPPRDDDADDDDGGRQGGDQDGGHHGAKPRGRQVFEKIGCAVCHRPSFTAVSPLAALNDRKVRAFSDFLLHDVGTGDGIIQGPAPANVLRTPPLWGVSASAPYLHDGSAVTIRDAIRRHANQAAAARKAFEDLSRDEQEALLDFLDSI